MAAVEGYLEIHIFTLKLKMVIPVKTGGAHQIQNWRNVENTEIVSPWYALCCSAVRTVLTLTVIWVFVFFVAFILLVKSFFLYEDWKRGITLIQHLPLFDSTLRKSNFSHAKEPPNHLMVILQLQMFANWLGFTE